MQKSTIIKMFNEYILHIAKLQEMINNVLLQLVQFLCRVLQTTVCDSNYMFCEIFPLSNSNTTHSINLSSHIQSSAESLVTSLSTRWCVTHDTCTHLSTRGLLIITTGKQNTVGLHSNLLLYRSSTMDDARSKT